MLKLPPRRWPRLATASSKRWASVWRPCVCMSATAAGCLLVCVRARTSETLPAGPCFGRSTCLLQLWYGSGRRTKSAGDDSLGLRWKSIHAVRIISPRLPELRPATNAGRGLCAKPLHMQDSHAETKPSAVPAAAGCHNAHTQPQPGPRGPLDTAAAFHAPQPARQVPQPQASPTTAQQVLEEQQALAVPCERAPAA